MTTKYTGVFHSLEQSVVAICEPDGNVLGTGFFIGNDGSILTCFHVVGDKTAHKLYHTEYEIRFQGGGYIAQCVFYFENMAELDIAILRLKDGKLPKKALLIPLGKWNASLTVNPEYRTRGYRSSKEFLTGVPAVGTIHGRTESRKGTLLFTLSPQAGGQNQIRKYMSGAPVLHKDTGRIVGIITTRYRVKDQKDDEDIPLAIPIEEVARVWRPLKKRLKEDDLYNKLHDIFNPNGWYWGKRLQTLYDDLPSYFDFEIKNIENDDLFTPFLEYLKQNRSRLYIFITWLKMYDPDLKVEGLTIPHYYQFVNREEALEKIMSGGIYNVLEAPVGYGKTTLLRKIEFDYAKRKKWLPFYVAIAGDETTCRDLAADIQTLAGGTSITRDGTTEEEMGKMLGKRLVDVNTQLYGEDFEGAKSSVVEERGIVLLLDNLEKLSKTEDHSELAILVNNFIPSIQSKLRESNIDLRVCLAGRKIWEVFDNQKPAKLPLTEVSLRPFNFDVVVKAVTEEATLNEDDTQLIAAQLMNITGGHPGCMAQILHAENFTVNPLEFYAKNKDEYQRIVLDTADQIYDSLPKKLQDVFLALGFFRRFDLQILASIASDQLFDWPSEKYEIYKLSNLLTKTHLIRRNDGFLHDEIVRRMLTIRVRLEEPERFIDLYRSAQKIYEEYLQNDYAPAPYIITIEALFVLLQQDYYQLDKYDHTLREANEVERRQIRTNFFTKDSSLNRYLNNIIQRPTALDDLENLLRELEKDKEFQFVINYFLRQENFSTKPYKELKNYIKNFISDQYRNQYIEGVNYDH